MHASMSGDDRAGSRLRSPGWRGRWTSSIRVRVLAIALIPSAALLVTGATVAGYLVSEGLSARSFASQTLQSIGPIVQFEGPPSTGTVVTFTAR